jgi:hypothetical protein
MDPKVVFRDLNQSLIAGHWHDVMDALDALSDWMAVGGFVSDLSEVEHPKRPMPINVSDAIDVYNEQVRKAHADKDSSC